MAKAQKPLPGIAAGGNWIVDTVKTVNCLPGRNMLGSIVSQDAGPGGSPANVLMDLARMGASFPLTGFGIIGTDEDAEFLLDRCRRCGIDTSGMVRTDKAPTSYTDVMNEKGTGERMFFHHRGANALFAPEHVPVNKLRCRIFHLGYLLLLDSMDVPDQKHGTVAARLLRDVRARGIKTSLDVVSEESDRYAAIVPPALKHTDYLIINEIEAGRIAGLPVRGTDGKLNGAILKEAVDALFELGDMEIAAIHMAEGAYARDRRGNEFARGSLVLPGSFIRGAVGAGDAFCAGLLYGFHEGRDMEAALALGICAAAACLSSPNSTDGIGPADRILELADRFESREPCVEV
ncbi:MAG: carbohydrate kinase family protein [Kiritimatiellia bacterium]